MTTAYEEFYANFKTANAWEARKAAGKGAGIPYEELAAAYKEASILATTDEFRQMVTSLISGKLWEYSHEPSDRMYGMSRTALLDGALQSFKDGAPEKLQLAMTEFSGLFGAPFATLYRAMSESKDPYGTMQRFTHQILPEGANKLPVLDNALSYAVTRNDPPVISALLDGGANANLKSATGFPGQLLVTAVRVGAAQSTVKLLNDKGASFEDAIFLLQAQDGEKKDIDKLKLYQAKITGKPADTDVSEKLQAVLAEMLEMKREILALKKQVARLSKPKPEKKALVP